MLCLELLLRKSESVLDAELVMTSLLLPEFVKLCPLRDCKVKLLVLNGQAIARQLLYQLTLDSELREGNISFLRVAPCVNEFQSRELIFDGTLDKFPVNFEVSIDVFGLEMDD